MVVRRRKNAVGRKRKVVRRRGAGRVSDAIDTLLSRRRAGGAGFFDDVGNALSSANKWLRNNKIISTVSGALSKVGVPYAGAIHTASSALGYGARRRRPVRRRRAAGAGWRDALSAAHGLIKKHQLVSKTLTHFNHPKLASVAHNLGYGVRRRPVRRAVRRGRGGGGGGYILGTEQIAAPIF